MGYIQIEHISKSFGVNELFTDISFSIEKGQKIGLIAKNGIGKTTLLKIIANIESLDEGQVIMEKDINLSYLSQTPEFKRGKTILEAVLSNLPQHYTTINAYEEALLSNNQQSIDSALTQMDAKQSWDIETRLKQILGNLGIHNTKRKVDNLSGGEQKRLALAMTFIDNPDFVILDEPTNHLDLKSIEWLEDYLKRSSTTLLMVTHDRYFLDRVCNKILEIDLGKIFQYEGNFSYYIKKRIERYEELQAQADKAKNLLRKELDWASRMPKARSHKSKYRINAIDKLQEVSRQVPNEDKLKITSANQRIGKKIINISHISKAFGDKRIINDFSYLFTAQERVGIVGENGTGKSTFLNIITQNIEPDSGLIEIGETLKIGYYKQEGIKFDENQKVIDVAREVAEVVNVGNGQTLAVERFLNRFLFPNEMHYEFVSKLSGGEKRRLYLLTVLMLNPNFLILDEPTNDLDIMTLAVLEEYLKDFYGTVVIVSHDRYFMDQIVNHIFVFNGDGDIKDFPGNYSQYRDKLKQQENNGQKRKEKPDQKNNKKPREKTQLSYKEKIELETLEKELESMETQKTNLEKQMSSGDISATEIEKLSTEYHDLTNNLEQKEMRWLELTDLKEQLESKKNK